MHVHSINTLNNINFDGKLKPKKNVKKNLVNRVITPVIMGTLTAQLLKEQAQTNAAEAQQNKGYLKSPLTEKENARGYLLSDCFNFYKNPKDTQDNIVYIIADPKLCINDALFIKNVFEFIRSDLPTKAKSSAFNILSSSENSKLLETISVNYATYSEKTDDIEARFTIPDILALQEVYRKSPNKELILDMIKEGIFLDESELKTFRFELDDILRLNKCYIETPNKNLFLTLINQYEYSDYIDNDCPLYNADMIINLVENCIAKDKANFLSKISSEKIIKNGKKENRFMSQAIFIFNDIYNQYPQELEYLINQKFKNLPRFNTEQIITLIKKYEIIGESLIKIVKETNNDETLDFTSLMFLINEVEKQQTTNIKNKNIN